MSKVHITSEERKSAGYKVFHSAFEVILPQYATVSREEEKAWGTLVYKDKSVEASLAARQIHTVRTIAKLAELHSQGVPIVLVNPRRDASVIYNLIQRHLANMANYISSEVDFIDSESEDSVRIRQLVEDLEVLEAFAMAVYPKAVAMLPYANPNISMSSKINRFKMSRSPAPSNNAVKLAAGEPTTLASLLGSRQMNTIRSWSVDDAGN